VISIVIVDDHAVVRRGLRAVLEGEPDLVVLAEAADAAQAADALVRTDPDVLVLDLMMPGATGFDLMKALRARGRRARFVVLSMHDSEAYVIEALRCGASAYVVKDAPIGELSTAVREAAAGRQFLGSPFSRSMLAAYAERTEAAVDDGYEALTPREREVLQLAADGLTSQQIGERLAISSRTAETHRANLMRKLKIKGHKDLIRYALKKGIGPPGP
jgi:DNA-binding NarL/FixJ family response regulator